MADSSHAAEPETPQRLRLRASTLGTIFCILSAVAYTGMGICQRAVAHCDPVWVNCVQASVSTVVFGLYLTFTSARGRSAWPRLTIAAVLMTLGIVTQLGGSSYQWSISLLGLAVGNALQMGIQLAATALLGLLILRERITRRGVTAIVLITVSVFLLGVGAEAANQSTPATDKATSQTIAANADRDAAGSGAEASTLSGAIQVILGLAAACFAGVAFAILVVGVRKTATANTTSAAIVFFINAMGIAFLGPLALAQHGLGGLMATSGRDLGVMLAIGVFNLMGFLLLTMGLQLTSAVRINVINNGLTTALTVLAGLMIFAEPSNRGILIGIMLALVGIVLISYSGSAANEPEKTAATATETQDG